MESRWREFLTASTEMGDRYQGGGVGGRPEFKAGMDHGVRNKVGLGFRRVGEVLGDCGALTKCLRVVMHLVGGEGSVQGLRRRNSCSV